MLIKILKCIACCKVCKVEKFGQWILLSREEWAQLQEKTGEWKWDYIVCPECVRKTEMKRKGGENEGNIEI